VKGKRRKEILFCRSKGVLAECWFLHFLDIYKNQPADFQAFTYLKLRVVLRSERLGSEIRGWRLEIRQ
jgi:hypothetical protein